MALEQLKIGDAFISPTIKDGHLRSVGEVRIQDTRLRNAATRFLPWFDTYEGGPFNRFKFVDMEDSYDRTTIVLKAVSDSDYPFRERRDSSGDPCFRNVSWDAPAHEADFRIVFTPAAETVDGRAFTGFKYWFEYESDEVPIHRILDRQTWEIGGGLADVTLCLRNWLTPPRMRIARETTYSTVGLDKWAGLLPGNMWGRWTLLPSFDMQYGAAGVLLGWFDEVSLIRTAVESARGEEWIRFLDLHGFEQSRCVRTNPKSILWCADVLDEVDALNLWTRVQDLEHEKACGQLGIAEEEPPAIIFSENQWRGFRFDTTYEEVVQVASEFGADYVFIDPVWEHQQAYSEALAALVPEEKRAGTILEKFWHQNMCVTLDFEVAEILGGEAGLRALCERARERGVKIISWMAAHYSPNSALARREAFGHGKMGAFAAKESGAHPDTGYAASCWTANLNGPILEHVRQQVLGVCERTGLAGFLWDSYCNLGWWQVDYSAGTMRPQFDKQAELYADLTKAGLFVMPEAIVTFSNHSCCGLHGGNIYRGDLIGYAYNTNIAMQFDEKGNASEGSLDAALLAGGAPFEMLFESVAHKRLPSFSFHRLPRGQWDAARAEAIKGLLRVYKENRHLMRKRTVLKDGLGVLWEGEKGERLVFAFTEHEREGEWEDAATGETAEGVLRAGRVYRGA